MRVGILAYGSLIDNPGKEITEILVETRSGVTTPFPVEYAHSSKNRKGAPTLVPVEGCGGCVQATVFVLRDRVSASLARDMLYRREIDGVGSDRCYVEDTTKPPRLHKVYIRCLTGVFGLDIVLYTHILPDIEPLTADHLADLAIESARSPCGANRRDGISYLQNAIENGIQTPLTRDYCAKILEKTGASDLEAAWQWARRPAV
jgi:cation transport regulator ChaC